LILFLANDFKCRLCIGFTPKPDLPSSVSKKAKKETAKEKSEDNSQTKKKQASTVDKESTTSYWVEYFDETENEWISVHPMIKDLCNAAEIETYRPFSYVLGIDNGLGL
jgi:hypothetical protein